jgi:hypothetical protein
MESNEFVSSKMSLLNPEVHLPPERIEVALVGIQRRTASKDSPAKRSAAAESLPTLVVPPHPLPAGGRPPYLAIAASIAVAAFLIAPPGRVLAQSVWRSIILQRVQTIQLDFARTSPKLLLPNVFPLGPYGKSWRPATLFEAEQLTGFHILTMASPQLPYQPTFRVEDPPPIERKIDVAEIREELKALGRPPVEEPSGIDGVSFVVRQKRMVVTSYGSCPQIVGPWRACAFLVQSQPYILELPPEIDPDALTRYSLELAGFSPSVAAELMARTKNAPTMYLPTEPGTTLETVTVRGQTGNLMRYADGVAFVLAWREGEFQFTLFGRDPEQAIRMAETLR